MAQAARAYLALGWAPVPVPYKQKRPGWPANPGGEGWQNVRLTAAVVDRFFPVESNIGVILGPPSHGLADIDLDCDEAIELAPLVLPATWTFGRAGKPKSHWLYIAEGAESRAFRDVKKPGEKSAKTLLELRAKPGDGIGHQTVMPSSTHPSGERIDWSEDLHDSMPAPLRVDAGELLDKVRTLAAATLALRHCGRDATVAWLSGGAFPRMGADVAAHMNRLLDRRPPPKPAVPQSPASGPNFFEAIRAMHPGDVAAAFGVEVDMHRGIRVCPACGADTRSSHDKRPAAGFIRDRDDGRWLWAHGKCGSVGDSIDLVALLVARERKPKNWKPVFEACEANGLWRRNR